MSDGTPRHPTDQTMAAYVDGRLARAEINAVNDHLRECTDCRYVVEETARFERENRAETGSSPTRYWWLAAAAAAIVLIATPLVIRWNTNRRSAIARLIAMAPRDHRTLEPRLSGFPWARLRAPSRGAAAQTDRGDLKLAGAAGAVLEQTEDRSDAASRHATGIADLLTGKRNVAIVALDLAARGSRDARTWNDLAAARYAESDDHPSQINDALEDVEEALRIDPTLPEARFNYALILERLGALQQARAAWQAYLSLDAGSEWSVEARAHLRKLQPVSRRFDKKLLDSAPPDELVRAFPEETRRWSETVLLASWADAELRRAGAAAILRRARSIADALARFNGDRLLSDAVSAIERASDADRASLAEAQQQYDAARKAFARRELGTTESGFRASSALFAAHASAMADVAAYYGAAAALIDIRSEESRALLMRLLPKAVAEHHLSLAASIHWTLATEANRSADWGTAIREADAATAIFRGMGERANAAFTDGIAACALEIAGDANAATLRRRNALAVFCDGRDAARCNSVLDDAAATLAATQRAADAAALTSATVDVPDAEPSTLAINFAKEGRVLARSGRLDAARDALARGRKAATRIHDAALREMTSEQIAVEEAALRTESDPRGAIAVLDGAAALFARQRLDQALPYVDIQRARAHRAAGDLDEAARDYASAVELVTRQEHSIADPILHLTLLDTATEALEESLALELSRKDTAAAFAIADRRHALKDIPLASAAPARDVAIIEYAVLPRSLAIFSIVHGRLEVESVTIDRNDLAERVDAFAAAISRRASADEIERDGAALHRLVIDPLRARLTGTRELVIVPDRELYALPFAALYDEHSARFLVEEFTIRLAPAVIGPHDAFPRTLAPAVVIANGRTPGMAPLRAAHEEGERIAALYGATLVADDDATMQRFLDLAQRGALIHFAGHANSDTATSYSALQLADGVVSASDVARLRLGNRPLVILAACGTFRGETTHTAGMSSLARAFLTAGARGVVATMWEIDDALSAPMFLQFHLSLRAGASPADALRAAQLAMLHSADAQLSSPATWSPVIEIENV